MTADQLRQWIASPGLLNRETLYELRTALARYPYSQTLRLLFLQNLYLLHDSSFGDELRKAALYIGDRRVLYNLIEGEKIIAPAGKPPVSPEETSVQQNADKEDTTIGLIDAFLEKMPDEDPLLSDLDYTADYSVYLLDETPLNADPVKETPPLQGHNLIDGFIKKSSQEQVVKQVPDPDEEEKVTSKGPNLEYDVDNDESFFTETLAKIYIKQKRYGKALEIIKKLSLKYPKKNAYFADQIRFLELLIINAKSK